MGLSVAVAPALEPVALDVAKAHLRVVDSEEDGLIAGYILAARQFCENETRRPFVTRTYDFTIDGNWPNDLIGCRWSQRIRLPVAPVSAVSSITYVDGNGAMQTLDGSLYVLLGNEDKAYIEPPYGVTWPTVRDQAAAITVRFVAGWAAHLVPWPLRQAICFQVEVMLDRNPAQNSLLEGARDALMQPYRLQSVSY